MDTLTDLAPDRGIGDNQPPGALATAIELTSTATSWLAERPEITDADTAKEAGEIVDKLRATKKSLAAAQKDDLAPHDQAIAEIKAQYKEPASKLEAALNSLLTLSAAWLKRERDRIAAEKAAQEAEARRLREEAERAEREKAEAQRRLDEERRRVAAEEEERKRAAAAEEQTKLERVAAEGQATADLERVEAERQEAARAAAEAEEKAKAAKAAEREAQRKTQTAAIKSAPSQRAMTLRSYWSAVIDDEAAALESYKDHPTVRKAALAAVLQAANEDARRLKNLDAAPLGIRFIHEERAQ